MQLLGSHQCQYIVLYSFWDYRSSCKLYYSITRITFYTAYNIIQQRIPAQIVYSIVKLLGSLFRLYTVYSIIQLLRSHIRLQVLSNNRSWGYSSGSLPTMYSVKSCNYYWYHFSGFRLLHLSCIHIPCTVLMFP